MSTYEQYASAFAGIPMPFAFLDLDLLAENTKDLLAASGGKAVRIATKSLRSVDVLRHIMASSGQFCGVMSYTAEEALFLAERGIRDVLIGYPVYDRSSIEAIARKAAEGHSITLMVDTLAHVERIEQAAASFGVSLPVCIDFDMSSDFPGLHFGVWRSSLRTVDQAVELAKRIASSRHVFLDGIMGYEAQIAGIGDALPGQRLKNALVRWLKRKSRRELADRRAALVTRLNELGISLRFVNGGGTGSLHTTRLEDAVTEVTVGSGFYAPGLFDQYRDFKYRPAAGYAIEIVRQPRDDLYTCLGGGYTASGVTTPDKAAKPYLPDGAELTPLEGAGEVQTPIRYRGPEKLAIGASVFMRHAKAGELCERFLTLHCIAGGRVVGEMKTYRGEGRCFL